MKVKLVSISLESAGHDIPVLFTCINIAALVAQKLNSSSMFLDFKVLVYFMVINEILHKGV